jgi:predicted N-acetyltransferase YhbS
MNTSHSARASEVEQDTPCFPLSLVEESQMPEALDMAIRELLTVCFPDDAGVFSQSRHWHGSAPAYSLVHLDGNQVLGHVGVVMRTIMASDRRVQVAGIQNLAVRPNWRAKGLGPALMIEAMNQAKQRAIGHGLLFCVPRLEPFYGALGWSTVSDPAVMLNEQGRLVPIPGKNICMVKCLAKAPFPSGIINLQGADW